MAGMGETCNHVTALIYFVEAVDSSNRFDQFCLYKQCQCAAAKTKKLLNRKR